MILGIGGTPGTGKTVVAKLLAKRIGVRCVELSKLVKEKRLYTSWDGKRKSFVVSRQKLLREFRKIKKANENLIVDGHFVEEIRPDVTVVLRCRPDVLEKRLRKRKYPAEKIRENVLAEILDVCAVDAGNPVEIETHNRTPKQVVKLLERIWRGQKTRTKPISYFGRLPAFLKKKHG